MKVIVITAYGGPEVLERREMPGAEWFSGARLNYSEHIFAREPPHDVAIVHRSESRPDGELTWAQLRAQVAQGEGDQEPHAEPQEAVRSDDRQRGNRGCGHEQETTDESARHALGQSKLRA